MTQQTVNKDTVTLKNDVKIDLLRTGADGFSGIGNVSVGGVLLRNGSVPMRPWIKSIDGMDYAQFRLDGIDEKPAGVTVRLTALGVPRHEEAYGDQYNDHIFRLHQQDMPVMDRLELHLKPESLTLHGVTYHGFSYAWAFESQTVRLHRLVTIATWELGGSATGNTILSQGQVTPAVYTAEKDTHFTSACLISLRDFGKPNSTSFQWSPRWSPHQCFDFFASQQGTLFGYWDEKADVRSFIQKNPGEEVFFVADAEHWKAAKSVRTARKIMLFAPAGAEGMPEHVMRNRWMDAYDHACQAARNLFGIKKTRTLPERTLPYSCRVEPGRKCSFQVGEKWVPSQEWLYAMADGMLPSLAKQGVRRVIPQPIHESDPTQNGFECKLDKGIHGDINYGSVCCSHRYRPAEFFGGMKAWKYFVDKAHALGLEVGHWVGMHLAYSAPILQEHPEWALAGFNTLSFAGGYPNFCVRGINFDTPVRQWIVNDLKAWKEEGGLDYIWLDSFANLGALAVDYSRDAQPNAIACAQFIADIQGIGIRDIAVEGMSPFVMSGAHIMDVDPAKHGGVQWIAGQNVWAWYDGNEDLLVDQQPRTEVHRERTEDEARTRLFRCVANRMMPELTRFAHPFGTPYAWYKEYLDNYFAVETEIASAHRALLPEKRGVVWENGGTRVLFAYADGVFDVGRATSVERFEAGKAVPVKATASLPVTACTVYRIRGS